MANSFQGGVVIYAKDIGRVSRFYAKLVGLEVTQREAGFVLLESAAFQLIIVAMAPEFATQITISSPPIRREDTALKICLPVADIAAARETAGRLGGELDGAEREWDFMGSRVCDGHDPEGNVIQVRAAH